MSSLIVSSGEDEAAYAQIEAAVMETARGRWFLGEFARRNRHAETTSILSAIERLQESIVQRPVETVATSALNTSDERLRNEILDMARAIAATQREIVAMGAHGATTTHVSASDELDDVVHTTEQATTTILASAERVQEFAWTLRENAGNAEDCDLLDRCATEIYTACTFQDLTAQRIVKVVEALRFIDQRLKALLVAHDLAEDFAADEMMIAENAEPAPLVHDDVWMSEAHQAEIDDTFAFFEPAAAENEPTMVGAGMLDMDFAPATPRAAFAPATETLEPQIDEPLAEAAIPEADFREVDADDADIIAPAPSGAPEVDPYAALSTESKLRAFR